MRIAFILLTFYFMTSPIIAAPNPSCICTKNWQPVCGNDGKTYGNACEADCAGVTIIKNGKC